MDVFLQIVLVVLGSGVVMLGYRKIKEFLRNRDDNVTGADDIAATVMDLLEGASEEGLTQLKDVIQKKLDESNETKEE